MYKQYPNDYFVDISGFGRNLSRGAYIIFLSRGGGLNNRLGPKPPWKPWILLIQGGSEPPSPPSDRYANVNALTLKGNILEKYSNVF